MNTPATIQLIANLHPADLIDFEERAAIMEHMGGLSREDAERLALAEIMGKRIVANKSTVVQS